MISVLNARRHQHHRSRFVAAEVTRLIGGSFFVFRFVFLGATLFCASLLSLGSAADVPATAAPAQPDNFKLTADVMQGQPPALAARGNARLVSGEWTLTADEVRYNYTTQEAEALGNVVITRAGLRLLGDRARYWTAERRIDVENFRLGHPPYYFAGRHAFGDENAITCEKVDVYYGEPGRLAPHATAATITVHRDKTFTAGRLRFTVGPVPVFAFAGISRPLTRPNLEWETRTGFDDTLGLQIGAGIYTPWRPTFSPGGSVDIFTKRGVMFGPGARYGSLEAQPEEAQVRGAADAAFISDTGDRDVDILGRPIDKKRGFGTWRHQQRGADGRWTFNGNLHWWSDSDVIRDFRSRDYQRNQEPDNFAEASWYGTHTIISALVRGRPNDFQVVRERLPELRVDLLPMVLPKTGLLVEAEASAAALREKPLGNNDTSGRRSDRLDAYLGLSRTFVVAKGTTFTPVLGGRGTHYLDAEGGRDSYTRWLGEVGFDARTRAFRTWDFKKPWWGVDGVRHILEPYVSYRYVPQADRGRAFIPDLDRPVFLPQLRPIGLAGRRDIDELGEIDVLRIGVSNLVETRRPDYGARRLLRFDLGADVHFDDSHEGDRVPDVFTEFHVTPASWLDWWSFVRFDPEEVRVDEFNTRFAIVGGRAWSGGVGVDFLRNEVSQYLVFGRYALNEASQILASVRYDSREQQFNDIELEFVHRLHQNWEIAVGVHQREGTRRESGFGIRLDLEFIAF